MRLAAVCASYKCICLFNPKALKLALPRRSIRSPATAYRVKQTVSDLADAECCDHVMQTHLLGLVAHWWT